MNIVPKMDDKKEGRKVPHVYKRRILDSKDIDFVVQYYVQNLNKQHHVYEKKKTRNKKIVAFSCVVAVLLILAAYNASVRFSGYFHESKVISTQKLPTPSKLIVKQVSEKVYVDKKAIEKKPTVRVLGSVLLDKKQGITQKSTPIITPAKQEKVKKLIAAQKTKKKSSVKKPRLTTKKGRIKQSVKPASTPSKKIKLEKIVQKSKKPSAQAMASAPGIVLTRMVMCEGVKNLKPVSPGENFSSRRVYCWVRLKSKKIPYKLNFTFYHEGKWIHRHTTTIKRKNAVTWCYKTIWEKGEWRVRLTDENEDLIGYKTFTHE